MTFGLYKDQRGRYTIAREKRNAKLILGSSNIEKECDVSAPTYTEALRFVKKEMPNVMMETRSVSPGSSKGMERRKEGRK